MAAKLESKKAPSLWESATGYLRESGLNWRVAVPVAVGSVLVFAVLIHRQQSSAKVTVTKQTETRGDHAPGAGAELLPTLANYHQAASHSLQELDEMLAEQAGKSLPPAPDYTVSTLTLATGAD